MAGMFDTALRAADASGEYDEARTCAVQALEQVKSLPYETVEAGGGVCEPSGLRYEMATRPVGTDLRGTSGDEGLTMVTITVDSGKFIRRFRGRVEVVNRAGGRNREAGFTLVEVMVASTMMFAALYAIFDVSVRAFGYGGDRVQAVGDARLALDRMEREIRAAYPYDPISSPPRRYLFLDPLDPTRPAVPTATRIAFGNETDGDRKIGATEVVGYYLGGHDLKRSKGGSAQTLVDSVTTNGLHFTPCRTADDCPPAVAIADEAEIRIVRIELDVEVERRGEDPARQKLATDVYLRNRGGR